MAGHDKERDRGHDHRSNGSTVQAAGAELARQGTEDLRRLSSFLGSTPVAPAILDHSRALPQAARHQKDALAAGGVPGQRRLALRAISLPASLLAPLNSEAVALCADRA
jgi:hypothetical protein